MPEEFVLYPIMLFDGDCDFCRHWIEKWRRVTREKVHYFSYQEALVKFPSLTDKECRESVRLVLPDGSHFSGAHAVFKAFAVAGRYVWLLRCYEKVPFIGRISECFYIWVASHRSFLSRFYRS